MPTIVNQMPSSQAIAAGSTAIFNLPLGLAYHTLLLRHTAGAAVDANEATMRANLTAIRLILNGETKWEVDADVLIVLQKFYQQEFVAGVLPLYLARPWQRTLLGEDEFAWPTGDGSGVQTLTLEVDIDGAAVTPTLTLFAEQGPQKTEQNPQGVLGRHIAVRKFAKSVSTTGVHEIADLPRGQFGLMAAHFDTANISDVEVQVNQREIFEGDTQFVTGLYGTRRSPQAGYTHVDFAYRNRVSDVLPLNVEDFRLKPNITAAGAFNIYLERVEDNRLGQ